MRTRRLLLALSALLAGAAPSIAQSFPQRPITIVVPFAAGGPIDTTTRIVIEHMKSTIGQPFVVENIGGAAGSVAAKRVAGAAPDGYTLITGIWGTHVANGAVYQLPYDVKSDFAPVALLSSNPLLIVSSKKVPATSVRELMAWLKSKPGEATQGTSGLGSVGHIAGAFFQARTGTSFRFVAYRGLAPAMNDLIAGSIDLMFDTPATSLPQVEAGSIRAYAVTAPRRLPAAPGIPTVDEVGLADLHMSTWTAFFAPKGTPADIVAAITRSAQSALADAQVRKRLGEVGQDVYPPDQQTAEHLAKLQGEEIKKWWPIIKAAGIKAE